ncbi:hypothetical protein ACK342_19005 [Aeromonas veronii]|uniref:hypothetical protein n=1 Tax=Aeromonas veronii TaxID=654 RepID=UPI001F196B7E|nr:hypothetical protein [Aeromonas veronii]MCF5873482.1 hypothetical protein [Aeromonas veronii]
MSSCLLKLIKWSWPVLFIIPGVYPFINGFGCKYTFIHDGKYNLQEGVCKAGILDVYIKNKVDESVVLKRFLWGSSSNYIYTYYIKQQEIKPPKDHGIDRINKLYDTSPLISGYRVKIAKADSTYLTFYEQPLEIIYVSKVKGKMGLVN